MPSLRLPLLGARPPVQTYSLVPLPNGIAHYCPSILPFLHPIHPLQTSMQTSDSPLLVLLLLATTTGSTTTTGRTTATAETATTTSRTSFSHFCRLVCFG